MIKSNIGFFVLGDHSKPEANPDTFAHREFLYPRWLDDGSRMI